MYKLVKQSPLAQFYYNSGSHSHPVRREVLIVENLRDRFTGYELREGNICRDIDNAPVKTYLKSKIATRNQCRNDSKARKVAKNRLKETTLVRTNLNNVGSWMI